MENKNKKEPHQNYIDLKLDPSTATSTIVVGASKTGKSTLYLHLYKKYFQKNKDMISILFNPNHHALKNVTSKNKIPKELIVSSKYDPSIIQDMQRINHRVDNKYEFLICMDDVVDKKNDKMLKNLILTYRNSNINSIVCLQDPTLLAKTLRNNCNNIIFFAFRSDESIKDTIDRYFKAYLGDMSLSKKIQWYKDKTADHKFIYLDTRTGIMQFGKIPLE